MIAEADGQKRQVIAKADAYYLAHENDAKAIKIAGENEVKGIQAEIKALQADGSEEMVRLMYGQALLESGANFITIQQGQSGNGNLNLQTMDVNDIMARFGELGFVGKHPAQKKQEGEQQGQQGGQEPILPTTHP